MSCAEPVAITAVQPSSRALHEAQCPLIGINGGKLSNDGHERGPVRGRLWPKMECCSSILAKVLVLSRDSYDPLGTMWMFEASSVGCRRKKV